MEIGGWHDGQLVELTEGFEDFEHGRPVVIRNHRVGAARTIYRVQAGISLDAA